MIIGAGPAGLTAAYELSKFPEKFSVTVLEESNCFGGIARTVEHNGNRMDMGGHRFFSKVPAVNDWWERMMPTQGKPAKDYVALGRACTVKDGGPDPEQTDRVMLRRNRLSRIFFRDKFFDYPIKLSAATIRNMGLCTTIAVGCSYLWSTLFKRQENSLEDFYVNRFGKKLYSMFFENYTENLWGRHPRNISPEWGKQRVKGLSILVILRTMLEKFFHRTPRKVETSLIEEFAYPKLGPGQLWELTAHEAAVSGANIITGAKAVRIRKSTDNLIDAVTYVKGGREFRIDCDVLISSMPLKDLVGAMNDVPDDIRRIANGLPYRDYMTVGVLVSKLNLRNETDIKTAGNIIPDDWVYVHNRNVKMGRFQVYNNWSPYMVRDNRFVWMGLEYFCNEGDELWSMSDDAFATFAVNEMVTMNLIDDAAKVTDFHVERVRKAYPAYFDTYAEIDTLRNYLDTVANLFCVGRNGQHRYNNLDHSMCTSFEAVKNILAGTADKSNIWSVNTEKEYHEAK